MAEQHSEDFWSLVLSGSRYFLGVIKAHNAEKNTVKMEPCYEVSANLVPMRGPQGHQVLSKNISADPVLVSFAGSPMTLFITAISKGEDMQVSDQARYKKLAANAEKMALEARAADFGITTSGAAPPNA